MQIIFIDIRVLLNANNRDLYFEKSAQLIYCWIEICTILSENHQEGEQMDIRVNANRTQIADPLFCLPN